MPVTVTAKRALRSSKRKEVTNKLLMARVEVAIRKVLKENTKSNKSTAESLIDRATKRSIIHKNKAARMKSKLSKPQKPDASKKQSKPKK